MIRNIGKLHIQSLLLVIALIANASCNRATSTATSTGESFEYSTLLSLDSIGGYAHIIVKNPWKDGEILQSYLLVPRDSAAPEKVPAATTIVRTPLSKSIVYSTVHTSAIHNLTGSMASIAGVCDAQYFYDSDITTQLASGKITDCGSSQSPNIEVILSLDPDAILLSPFMNSGHGALEALQTPIIECADYMENHPLGRAEWIKFFGMLTARESEADSIFANEVAEYNSLKSLAQATVTRPKVITEQMINGVWFVPGGASYMATLLVDAGANYPWADNESSGSLQLDFAQVYDKAHDADFWLIRTFGDNLTAKSLINGTPLYANMDAIEKGGVYYCNTAVATLFSDFPFAPSKYLRELIKIFHPEELPHYTLQYYAPIGK